jgi:hypothetical protein
LLRSDALEMATWTFSRNPLSLADGSQGKPAVIASMMHSLLIGEKRKWIESG